MNWRTIQQPLSSTRLFVLAGHLYFVAMLIMSIMYFQERMLAMDTAYYAFKVIVHQDFFTGHERTISYVPQLFPLLAIQLGWSLKSVLIAYSAGFILFYYAAYNVVVHLFRNPAAGILLALALGLTVRYKFYGPVGEVVLALVPLVVLMAWLSKPQTRFAAIPAWADVGIGIILGALLLTSHPFITISTAIGLGFMLLYQNEWRNPRFWITAIVTGALLFYQFVLGERNAYEAERADRLNEAWQVLSNLPDYYISEVIWKYFDTQYIFPFVVFLAGLISLIWVRRFWLVLYTLISFLAILAIIIVMHAYMSSNIFIMLDGYLAHLGFVWALPLAYHWLNKKRSWMWLTICGLLVFSLARISDTKAFFQQRLEYVHTALKEQTSPEQPKAVAYLEDLNYEKLWIGWALGIESLMLSSLEGPEHSRNIYLADKRGDLEGRFDEPELFLSVPFGPEFIKSHELPGQYFKIPAIPYREIELPR